jgi:class 3 adenylate cyclase
MNDLLSAESEVGAEGALRCAVMFVDLVNSSEFASVLRLSEYAAFVHSFRDFCVQQCQHYFDTFLKGQYRRGRDYEFAAIGDELVVFLHSGRQHNDVYQLVCLAIALKCCWLVSDSNRHRLEAGVASAELAVGIHCGQVWARRTAEGFLKTGFAINLAKRVESASREGERFRIYLSDPAFKQVNRRMRNLLFGSRRLLPLKGVVVPVAIYELCDSFANPMERVMPGCRENFLAVSRLALASNFFDLWVHSCLQVWEEYATNCVSDERLILCEQTLNIDAKNAVALYYAAQGARERGDMRTAKLYLEDLVCHWPAFGDGWLEYSRALMAIGESQLAREALWQAKRHGVQVTAEEMSESSERKLPGE